MRVKTFDHIQANENRIRAGPRTRAVMQEPELRGEVSSAAQLHKKIYSTRVLLKAMSVAVGKAVVNPLSHIAELVDPLNLVVLDRFGAEHFRQSAGRIAPQYVHLPEPILRSDIALRQQQIVLAGSLDMRNSVTIAADGHRRRKTGQPDGAV